MNPTPIFEVTVTLTILVPADDFQQAADKATIIADRRTKPPTGDDGLMCTIKSVRADSVVAL